MIVRCLAVWLGVVLVASSELSAADQSVLEWLASNTPANRQALATWLENFLELNQTAEDREALGGRRIAVRFMRKPAVGEDIALASASYEPTNKRAFVFSLNSSYWLNPRYGRTAKTADLDTPRISEGQVCDDL